MIEYKEELLRYCIDEVKALVPQQWAEMAQGMNEIEENTDWDEYLASEGKKEAFLITARRENLIGYFGMRVKPFASSQKHLAATSLPYFVVKCRDRGLILRRLIRVATETAKARGATMVAIKTHPWASAAPLLERMRFKPLETWYTLKI